MSIELIFFGIGLIVFVIGLFRFWKDRNNEKTLRTNGAIAYGGFALSLIAGIMLLEPFLEKVNSIVLCVSVLAVFSVAGRIFLKPGFKKK